jgi:hypothetical protein
MARRIAAILLLEPALNANYDATKEAPYRGALSQQVWGGKMSSVSSLTYAATHSYSW